MTNDLTFPAWRMLRAQRGPTRPEQKLIDFFKDKNLPYKYTGDGSFSVGRKIPDFVNINGEKKAVDLLGDYWHSKNFCDKYKQGRYETPEERIAKFKEYGWDLVVIWEKELKITGWKDALWKALK
jgi:G:T-mismatch repair DNA endonuclease (very short patch repair protein)